MEVEDAQKFIDDIVDVYVQSTNRYLIKYQNFKNDKTVEGLLDPHDPKQTCFLPNNNEQVDYVKQAIFCAKRVKKYTNLDVTLVTDSSNN